MRDLKSFFQIPGNLFSQISGRGKVGKMKRCAVLVGNVDKQKTFLA